MLVQMAGLCSFLSNTGRLRIALILVNQIELIQVPLCGYAMADRIVQAGMCSANIIFRLKYLPRHEKPFYLQNPLGQWLYDAVNLIIRLLCPY